MTDVITVSFTPGSGDDMAFDSVPLEGGGTAKVGVGKMMLGAAGENGGLATDANPFPFKLMIQNFAQDGFNLIGEGNPLPIAIYGSATPINVILDEINPTAGTVPIRLPADEIPLVTQTSDGTIYFNSSSGTNDQNLYVGRITVATLVACNTAPTPAYLKLYETFDTPVVGTDTPIFTVVIPAESSIDFPLAATFGNGLGVGLTTGMADSDTGGVGAGEVKILFNYHNR